MLVNCCASLCFVFNEPATPEIYTLALHDALPIYAHPLAGAHRRHVDLVGEDLAQRVVVERIGLVGREQPPQQAEPQVDRKSTRLNSSHANISYAVFCLKKKNICTVYRV